MSWAVGTTAPTASHLPQGGACPWRRGHRGSQGQTTGPAQQIPVCTWKGHRGADPPRAGVGGGAGRSTAFRGLPVGSTAPKLTTATCRPGLPGQRPLSRDLHPVGESCSLLRQLTVTGKHPLCFWGPGVPPGPTTSLQGQKWGRCRR